MKIAVCYSGQSRTWKTALENSKRFYTSMPNSDVDFFCHVWEETETVQSFSQNDSLVTDKIDKSDIDGIREILSPKMIAVEKPIEHITMPDRWCHLFYSMSRSIGMMQEYAMINGIQYDLVIKSRYDVIHDPLSYLSDLPFHQYNFTEPCMITSYCHYMTSEYFGFNFSDVCFMGDMHSFVLLRNYFFKRLGLLLESNHALSVDCDNAERENAHDLWEGPGVCIFKHLSKHNIRFYNEKSIGEFIVRKDDTLDALDHEDFKILVERHWEWYT